MPFAAVISRGARLKALFGVNGSQKASRSLVWRVAKLAMSAMVGLAVLGRQLFGAASFQTDCAHSRTLFHESLQAGRLHQTRADGRVRFIAAARRGRGGLIEQTPSQSPR